MRLYDLESYSYNTYIHKNLSFFLSLPYIYIDVYLHQLEVGENLTYLI